MMRIKINYVLFLNVYALSEVHHEGRQTAFPALFVPWLCSPPAAPSSPTLLLSLMYICAELLCPCCSSLCLSESL